MNKGTNMIILEEVAITEVDINKEEEAEEVMIGVTKEDSRTLHSIPSSNSSMLKSKLES